MGSLKHYVDRCGVHEPKVLKTQAHCKAFITLEALMKGDTKSPKMFWITFISYTNKLTIVLKSLEFSNTFCLCMVYLIIIFNLTLQKCVKYVELNYSYFTLNWICYMNLGDGYQSLFFVIVFVLSIYNYSFTIFTVTCFDLYPGIFFLHCILFYNSS